MATPETYEIVFKKLAEAASENAPQPVGDVSLGLSPEEFDEIDELRRLAVELQSPEPQSYTTT